MSQSRPVPPESTLGVSPAEASRLRTSSVVRCSALPSSGWACRCRRTATSHGSSATRNPDTSSATWPAVSISRAGYAGRSGAFRTTGEPHPPWCPYQRRSRVARGATCQSRAARRPDDPTESEAFVRLVRATDVAQRVADLADRRPRPQRIPQRVEHVVRALGRVPDCVHVSGHGSAVALGPQRLQPAGLLLLDLGVHPERVVVLVLIDLELVDPDDRASAILGRERHVVRRVLDLALLEAPLDGLHRAAHVLDSPHQLAGGGLHGVGHRLDHVGAGERVHGRGHIALVGDHLLSAQCQPGSLLTGSASASSKELVCRDWVPPSTAANACTVTRIMFTSGCWAVS